MINITKNAENDCVFTLQENSTLFNEQAIIPYYLFAFTSQQSNNTVYFVADDISTCTTSYNEFIITETGSTYTNLTGGTINLAPLNFYDYVVYEQTTRDNLNPANSVGVVEKGIVFVSDIQEQIYTSFSPTGTTNDYIIYRP